MSIQDEIQKLTSDQDMVGLYELVPRVLKNKITSELVHLCESIEEIYEIWLFDFSCNKGGNPANYPYLKALDALKLLGASDIVSRKAEFLLCCGEYCKRNGDTIQALKHFKESEEILIALLSEQPSNGYAYSRLIYIYDNFPTEDPLEAEIKFIQALDLEKNFNSFDDKFSFANIYLLYRAYSPPNLSARINSQRKKFFISILEKARQDPLFGLKISGEFNRWVANLEKEISSEIKNEIIQILEMAMPCGTSNEKLDLVNAGHVFSKQGARFGRIDFLLTAESLFRRALLGPQAFSLIHVYIAEAQEDRAKLADKHGSQVEAMSIRLEIKDHYLSNWKLYQSDISYLSHAIEYLFNSVATNPISEQWKNFLNEIRLVALAAEKIGGGHYWFPYNFLFSIHLLLGEKQEAKLWLGRGYILLNTLVEEKIYELLNEVEKRNDTETAEFIRRLRFHLENNLDKGVWQGNRGFGEIGKMNLDEIEAWLKIK